MGCVPTGVCRQCDRPLTFAVHEGNWCDNLGWMICPSTHRSHDPVERIEGIDY